MHTAIARFVFCGGLTTQSATLYRCQVGPLVVKLIAIEVHDLQAGAGLD